MTFLHVWFQLKHTVDKHMTLVSSLSQTLQLITSANTSTGTSGQANILRCLLKNTKKTSPTLTYDMSLSVNYQHDQHVHSPSTTHTMTL